MLKGDSKCNGIVAVLFYDSKPVYFISNACENPVETEEPKTMAQGKGEEC